MTSKNSAKPEPGDYPRIGETVHYAATRHQCWAAIVTAATPPSAYNADDDSDAWDRRQAEDYQPVSVACFTPGQAQVSQAVDVPRSPDKVYAGTWHRIDECPVGR